MIHEGQCEDKKDPAERSKPTNLTDTVRLVYDKPSQKATLIQVLEGRDQLVTRAHLKEEKRCISI